MNVLLHNAVEYIDGQETGAVGMVLIRYVFNCDPAETETC